MILKLEKFLFYLFLILIPFQIRIFLINAGPPAGGEWNSVFVYLGDVVLATVLMLWILRGGLKEIFGGATSENRRSHLPLLLLLIFLVIALISIFVSSGTKISIFRWLKLVEFAALFVYIRATLITCLPARQANFTRMTRILQILIFSGLVQSILAIAQFIKQGSIGIKFIEAGIYSPDSPGVANFILNGERIMRSYGSFSHPNVLAGFLILAIFAFYALWLKRPIRLIGPIGLIGLIFGLFLTFSRTAILVFLIGSLAMFLIEMFKTRRQYANVTRMTRMKIIRLFGLFLISCMISAAILFPYLKARFFTISLEEQALDLRFFYNKIALSMIKDKPILGIGIGNFVNFSKNYETYLRAATKFVESGAKEIPQWVYQPVHNLYLLIGSEIGILGLIAFLGFIGIGLIGPIRRIGPIGFALIGFLILAFADHYFWTLQSGGLMFWLALGLAKNE